MHVVHLQSKHGWQAHVLFNEYCLIYFFNYSMAQGAKFTDCHCGAAARDLLQQERLGREARLDVFRQKRGHLGEKRVRWRDLQRDSRGQENGFRSRLGGSGGTTMLRFPQWFISLNGGHLIAHDYEILTPDCLAARGFSSAGQKRRDGRRSTELHIFHERMQAAW